MTLQTEMQFDGSTYVEKSDRDRLGKQLRAVYDLMSGSNRWFTLAEIESALPIRASQASISARIRDLRKPEFGGLEVMRRRRGDPKQGLHEYRLVMK